MCGVRLRIPSLPADNPQQAEEASQAGGNANHLCQKCEVGGAYEVTASDEGYHALFDDAVRQMQTNTGTKDKVAQYWIDILLEKAKIFKRENPDKSQDEITMELLGWLRDQPDLDPTQDTPVEILHTILLGIVKYVWHLFHTSLTDAQKSLFYNNNLIGKHFKTLMQTMAFHVHSLVTLDHFNLIQSVDELGAMLWVHEISNMDMYLDDLKILIGNTLDAFAAVDAAKIINKVKLHLLTHIIPDICHFGPIIQNSTEQWPGSKP
ncbi:hypothetical protein GYMLUDRAFT_78518 [Collybiopsis luxurians FD-317 M1]|uniref:Uncharacterized protein n=1 Tax=Collybiopsis luxurians FD-317 M1 TaxID=944289 RepID=A0A0D0BY72_9AGAR|nr:hypothetical protein GYMLUDRAFT_78518 [Collybiopsis luxurians FD-317 M1]